MSLVLENINKLASANSKKIAVCSDEMAISYTELSMRIADLAEQLADYKNSCVALDIDNSLAWVLLDLSFTKAQIVSIPIPPFFTQVQIAHAMISSGVKFLITDKHQADELVSTLIIAGQEVYIYAKSYKSVKLPTGTAKVTFTSGTTGTPKGVCLSQNNMEQVAASLVEVIGKDYAGIHLAIMPMAVLLENVAGLYTTLLAGGCYNILPLATLGFRASSMPDFKLLVANLLKSKATSCIMVPEILRGVMQVLFKEQIILPSLKFIALGGSKVSPQLLDQAEKLKLPVYQGYGLSESSSVIAVNTPKNNKVGSVGKILPHSNIKLADDHEIILKRQNFLGYIGESQKGDFATGDIGHIDGDGYLSIVGRKKNVIINSFGRNVAPEWPESELLAQKEIAQAFVFGDARPDLGALIVPSAANVSDHQIENAINNANKTLPEYAQIKHWSKVMPFTVTSGYLTGNGRLRRDKIISGYNLQIEQMYQTTGQFVTFFERLINETTTERNELYKVRQIQDGLQGQISKETYIHYLTEAYHHVKHTSPLLMLAGAKIPHNKEWLRDMLAEYIDEERGHQQWILNDIRHAGGDDAAVVRSEPRVATELMVAYAYDYINRLNPVGFFGMVFVLEGTSTQLATQGATKLMETLNLPENCFSYLLSHGSLDLSHMKFFQDLVNRIQDRTDQDAIIHVAKRVFVLFADVFRSIPHQPKELT